MSTRYIVVQIIGDTLKLPIADLRNLEVPFGSTRFDGIREIVLNPYSANPRRFTEVSASNRVCPNCVDGRERMFRANVEKNRDLMRLMDENAKLRQLVRHMYECMGNIDPDGNYECDSCEYKNTEGKCDFGRRMRELWVEL